MIRIGEVFEHFSVGGATINTPRQNISTDMAVICCTERISIGFNLNKNQKKKKIMSRIYFEYQRRPPRCTKPMAETARHGEFIPARLPLMLPFCTKYSVITRLTLCVSSIIIRLGGFEKMKNLLGSAWSRHNPHGNLQCS